MLEWGRLLVAVVTPFTPDGEVNVYAAARLAQALVEYGVEGLVVAGSTGESATLTAEEKLSLFRAVKGAVEDKAAVLAATGSNSTRDTLELTARAEACGVDGVMLVTPYYNKPSQEGLYQHFAAAAGATRLPIMLYDVPGRTGCTLTPETVSRLARLDNIVAIKDATGSLDHLVQIAQETPVQFRVYAGDDALTLPAMAVGAHGVVSVAGHLVPHMMQELIQSYLSGRVTRARELHLELADLFRVLFIAPNPTMVKAALNYLGFDVGGLRSPLVAATESQERALERVLGYFRARSLLFGEGRHV